jgi:hypothetical protein
MTVSGQAVRQGVRGIEGTRARCRSMGARNGSQRVQPPSDPARRSQNVLPGKGLPTRLSPTVTDTPEFPDTEEVTGSNPVRPTRSKTRPRACDRSIDPDDSRSDSNSQPGSVPKSAELAQCRTSAGIVGPGIDLHRHRDPGMPEDLHCVPRRDAQVLTGAKWPSCAASCAGGSGAGQPRRRSGGRTGQGCAARPDDRRTKPKLAPDSQQLLMNAEDTLSTSTSRQLSPRTSPRRRP